jgi:hypothetical protein
MGLGPYCTKQGDVAVILYGCELIVVLRSVESHFHLLRTAYMQGVMEGQLVHDLAETDMLDFKYT